MSQALYRQYRPQRFADVVGQDVAIRTLRNAIETDRVAHAYLFTGTRGTGKTTTAKLLAKYQARHASELAAVAAKAE